MRRTFTLCGTGVLTLVVVCSVAADNWPTWRGPEMNGVSSEKSLPLKWSAKENVRWRADLPSPGNSSPIVWGDRVFVAQADPSDNRRTLMCFDRANGKLVWQAGVTYAEKEPTQQNNPYCAGSPATDGEAMYICFGSAGATAYDFGGREVWHRDLGKLNHVFGTAVSVILHDELCILNFGPDEKARLIALDKTTGRTVWEATPPKPDESEVQQEMRTAFGGAGGPGGRRGFGPGMFLATPMVSQGDQNRDGKLTQEEFAALADAWFDKLDADKAGKLSPAPFTDRLSDVLPASQGFSPAGGGPPMGGPPFAGGRGLGPARLVGPGLFAAADADKDGSLTRVEWKGSFEKWFATWDVEKTGSLNEELVRDGLNATLPRPAFGGPGASAGPGGGGGRAARGSGGPGASGGPGGGMGGSWSTPIVVKTDGRDELIVNFAFRLVAFEPKTGKQLWTSKGVGGSIYTTPLAGEGTLIAMSSGVSGGSAIAVRPGGSGDVTESQQIWRLERVKSCIGSGVIRDGHVYTIAQDGIAACLDLKTGKTVWEQRLTARSGRNTSWSSMLLADGKIYVPNQSGDVFVLRAGPKFELLATNAVGESTNASLAASNGELFLRTDKSLWCLAGDRK